MRRYFGLISLVLLGLCIVFGFIYPEVLHPLPDSWDIVIVILLLIGSFVLALFSVKGYLKGITLGVSSIGMLGLGLLLIFGIAMILFGNFGS